jgi:hypothetical protein
MTTETLNKSIKGGQAKPDKDKQVKRLNEFGVEPFIAKKAPVEQAKPSTLSKGLNKVGNLKGL